jgi:hypothetical protein
LEFREGCLRMLGVLSGGNAVRVPKDGPGEINAGMRAGDAPDRAWVDATLRRLGCSIEPA